VCALLCFIKPIRGNSYGPGVQVSSRASQGGPLHPRLKIADVPPHPVPPSITCGVRVSSPSTSTTSLAIQILSSAFSNRPTLSTNQAVGFMRTALCAILVDGGSHELIKERKIWPRGVSAEGIPRVFQGHGCNPRILGIPTTGWPRGLRFPNRGIQKILFLVRNLVLMSKRLERAGCSKRQGLLARGNLPWHRN